MCGIADTGQDDPVGGQQALGIGRQFILLAQAFQSPGHRADIARIIIDNRYHNNPLLDGSSYEKTLRATAWRNDRAKALKMPSAR